jgi:sarcosine oxidase gamma subunit
VGNPGGGPWNIESDGLRVGARRGWEVASLRYFGRDGIFAAVVRECIGQSVPGPLQAIALVPAVHDAEVVLAWRSPTETLFLSSERAVFAEIQQRVAAVADGCMVDQTGGVSVLDVQGRRAVDLLQRMGARTCIPALGEARAGRMAEVHALTACIRPGEYLLFVERVYADHLAGWVRATAADMS